MIFLFWILTFALLVLAIGLLFPWFSKNYSGLFIFFVVGTLAYGMYFTLGNSQYLKAYYAINHQQRSRMQPLMLQLKKQEYRLRFYLEEHSEDKLAHSQLLEILGIQALQAENKALAKNCLKQALIQIEGMTLEDRKQHLRTILESLN